MISSKNDEKIHIALSPWDLTDDYNRHAGATLLSILEHSAQPVVAHLLYDEKLCIGKEKDTEYNKACYQKIADKYGCELQFHHVELPDWVNNLKSVNKWTPGALMRIYLPELLSNSDKVIYFDCDMIVNTDVVSLWNTQLDNKLFAACPDTSTSAVSHKHKKYHKKMGISTASYFCSGLLLFNLKQLRNLDKPFSETLFTYLHDNPNILFPDQDMLNWFVQDNYVKLDEKYNIYVLRDDAAKFADDCILHYVRASGQKPWKAYDSAIDDYYWKYLIQTPWCEDKETLMKYVRAAPEIARALPIIQKHFRTYTTGSIKERLGFSVKFTFDIWKTIITGIGIVIKNRKH